MKTNFQVIRFYAAVILMGLIMTACRPGLNAPVQADPTLMQAETTSQIQPENNPSEVTSTQTVQPKLPETPFPDLENLEVIRAENITDLAELARITAWSPPRAAISADGRIIALAGIDHLEVFDLESGELLMAIEVELPTCQFADVESMVLNADGSFIALITRYAVQVWQVSGGLLYENLFDRSLSNDPITCGTDMPQLALSPDGARLAISGMVYSRDSLDKYFRVVDIFKNEVLYEWNGNPDHLHGSLTAYQGLGFSSDGSLLAVFDPLKFVSVRGQPQRAFRYWSTTDWSEIPNTDGRLKRAYSAGELLFPLFTDEATEIRSRTTGSILTRLQQAPCSRLFPCAVLFSPDGKYALFHDSQSTRLPFKDVLLSTSLTIVDIEKDAVIAQPQGLFYDLGGLIIKDQGELISAGDGMQQNLSGAWWVRGALFEGLVRTPQDQLTFIPQVYYSSESEICPFCATCSLDLTAGNVDCHPQFFSSEGAPLVMDENGGQMVLSTLDGERRVELGVLEMPQSSEEEETYIRLLGASIRSRAVFYCLESNQRALGCAIRDLGTRSNLAEPKNISQLRFSPDGRWATFFDERQNELVILDLDNGRLTRRSAYEARAYPVAARFYQDGSALAFIIQSSGNDAIFWLELLETENGRSLGRVPLIEAAIKDPAFLDVDEAQQLWLVGDRNGRVAALDFSSGVVLRSWQTQTGGLIGLGLTANDRLLMTMEENGIIHLWGVSK